MSSVSRTRGQLNCLLHPKKRVVVQCQKCNILICQTCVLNEHLGHTGREIEEVAEVKYRHIDDFITKVEGTTIPKIRQNIQDAELDSRIKEEDLNSKINKAYEHEKYLHKLVIDNRIKTVTRLTSEITTIHKNLTNFQAKSVQLAGQLETSVSDCKDAKRSDNDILIIDEANEVDQLDIESVPVYTKISPPTVIFGANPVVDIEKAYGKMVGERHSAVDTLSTHQDISKPGSLGLIQKHDELNRAKDSFSSPSVGAVGGNVTSLQLLDQTYTETIDKHRQTTRETLTNSVITKFIQLSDNLESLQIQKNGIIWYCITPYYRTNVYQID